MTLDVGDKVLAYPGYSSNFMLWEEGLYHEGIVVGFRPTQVQVRFTKQRFHFWRVSRDIWISDFEIRAVLESSDPEVAELERMYEAESHRQ